MAHSPHIFQLLIQVATLLLAARMLGELAERWKQPSILGELAAGILLGPSFLTTVCPLVGPYILPNRADSPNLLGVFTLLGSMFLLLNAGRETDFGIIRNHLKTALAVSISGIVFPLLGGLFLGFTLPEFLMGPDGDRLLFALFLGTALSISSISVISRVLMDLNLVRRDVGQITIAACTIDDTAGWILVSLVSSVARVGHLSPLSAGVAFLHLAGFLLLNFTLGNWIVKRSLAVVQDRWRGADRLISLVVFLMFSWGVVALSLGLEPVVGAFFLGVLLASRHRLPRRSHERIQSVARAVFIPIFFAAAGLKVELLPILKPQLVFYGLVFLLVASSGKVLGVYLGARLVGRTDHWTALALGAGMNARGSMEIIVASLGLSLGIIAPGMFSIIIVMAMTMSLLTPSALQWLARKIPAEPRELSRLERESFDKSSQVGRVRRVLLALSNEEHGWTAESCRLLVERMTHFPERSLTVLQLGQEASATDRAQTRLVTLKSSLGNLDPGEAVLEECAKDYGMLVVVSPARCSEDISDWIQQVLRRAPCMRLLIRPSLTAIPLALGNLLVLTNGRSQAEEAAHLGLSLLNEDGCLHILHLLERDQLRPEHPEAQEFVERLGILARAHQRNWTEEIGSEEDSSGQTVLEYVEEHRIDLIILGMHLRLGARQIYLGRRVRRLLRDSQCPVFLLFVD